MYRIGVIIMLVGSRVRVVNAGYVYTTYRTFYELYGCGRGMLKYKEGPSKGVDLDVVALGMHEDGDKELAIVTDGEWDYIIGVLGIEVVTNKLRDVGGF